jgi:hypothetical protein
MQVVGRDVRGIDAVPAGGNGADFAAVGVDRGSGGGHWLTRGVGDLDDDIERSGFGVALQGELKLRGCGKGGEWPEAGGEE